MSLRERIKKENKKLGRTQKEFCEEIGVSQMEHIYKGNPTYKTCYSIAKELKITDYTLEEFYKLLKES